MNMPKINSLKGCSIVADGNALGSGELILLRPVRANQKAGERESLDCPFRANQIWIFIPRAMPSATMDQAVGLKVPRLTWKAIARLTRHAF